MEAGGRLDVPAHHEEADGLVVEQHGAGPGLALRCLCRLDERVGHAGDEALLTGATRSARAASSISGVISTSETRGEPPPGVPGSWSGLVAGGTGVQETMGGGPASGGIAAGSSG